MPLSLFSFRRLAVVALVLVMVGVLGAAIGVHAAAPLGSGSNLIWSEREPLPSPRMEFAATMAMDGSIYIVGGNDGDSLLDVLERYDPPTDTWETKAPMPTTRANLALVAADDGKLYAIGGGVPGELDTVEAYDPATDNWETVASMPTARRSPVAVLHEGKIWVIGGDTGGPGPTSDPSQAIEVYDPATNTWESKEPLHEYILWWVAGTLGPDGLIYLLGGFNGGFHPDAYAYDPATGDLQQIADLSEPPPAYARAVTLADRIYLLGGAVGGEGEGGRVEVYDPWGADAWTQETSLPEGLDACYAAVADTTTIYLLGCYDSQEFFPPADTVLSAGLWRLFVPLVLK